MSFIKRVIDYLQWISQEIFTTKSTAKIYDEIADTVYENTIDYNDRVAYLKKLLADLRPHDVLDLACGTGAIIDAIPNKKKAKILGTDISQGMLDVAKKRFKNFKNIRLAQADFLTQKFPASSFDLIAIAHATRFIPKNKQDLFAKNIASWLKKDGTFFVILHESPIAKLVKLTYGITGIPRGFNPNMEYADYFTKVVRPYLTLEKKVRIKQHRGIYIISALYFKKP